MIDPNPSLLTFYHCADNLKDDERRQFEALSGEPYMPDYWASRLYAAPGPKLGCIGRDGLPVAVGGYTFVRPGVWDMWMLSTPHAWPKSVVEITRGVLNSMYILAAKGAHRIECVSLADRFMAHKWYRALNLRRESPIPQWGANGEDAIQFAWVRDHD